jgi:hypothetical protein
MVQSESYVLVQCFHKINQWLPQIEYVDGLWYSQNLMCWCNVSTKLISGYLKLNMLMSIIFMGSVTLTMELQLNTVDVFGVIKSKMHKGLLQHTREFGKKTLSHITKNI